MAKANDEFDFLGPGFVDVNTVLNASTAAKKNPAGAMLYSTGRCEFNLRASEIQDLVAKAVGLPRDHYYAKFRVDVNAKTIAVLAVDGTVVGATDVRRNSDGKTITVYLHGVFEDHPDLRPAGDVEVKITRHASGKAAIINLAGGGLSVRHVPRDSSEETNKETTK